MTRPNLVRLGFLLATLSGGNALLPLTSWAEPVAVRAREGVAHGFLVLGSLDGKTLADGELTQFVRGERVTTRLVFYFRDGSLHDETLIFSQLHDFKLLSDHLVQRGPSFPQPMDVTVDAERSMVTVRYAEGGKPKLLSDHLALPADVANGLIFTLMKNVPETGHLAVSLVATTPKPRLVKLVLASASNEPFTIGAEKRIATHYVVKLEIGGIAGAVAPLVGKQPADLHVWIERGNAPAFVKAQGQLYTGGPVWLIRLASPTWPSGPAAPASRPAR